jgi:tetratricopeptide (TPR) repeat protein
MVGPEDETRRPTDAPEGEKPARPAAGGPGRPAAQAFRGPGGGDTRARAGDRGRGTDRGASTGRAGTPPRGAAGGGGRGKSTGGPRRGGASREEIAQRTYDPRREERRKATRVALPDDVDARMLDDQARRELRSLPKDTADLVGRHLVVTGQLLDLDPGQALAHARAARALAGRVGVVREAAGLAAYAAGEWSEALSELRAARRITGRPEHLGVLADCERALGRPERALTYADDPVVEQLSQDQRVELVIVLAGARRDLQQPDAAVLMLQDPARRTSEKRPWAARLWYAYADALLDAGREAQAREWFGKAAAVDVEGQTDAGDRVLALDGVVLEDADEDGQDDRGDLPSEAELADLVRDLRPLRSGRPDLQAVSGEPDETPKPEADASGGARTAPAGVPAHPVFVAPAPVEQDDSDGDTGDLRLFD